MSQRKEQRGIMTSCVTQPGLILVPKCALVPAASSGPWRKSSAQLHQENRPWQQNPSVLQSMVLCLWPQVAVSHSPGPFDLCGFPHFCSSDSQQVRSQTPACVNAVPQLSRSCPSLHLVFLFKNKPRTFLGSPYLMSRYLFRTSITHFYVQCWTHKPDFCIILLLYVIPQNFLQSSLRKKKISFSIVAQSLHEVGTLHHN